MSRIIAIVGPIAAGKTTAAKILVNKGYKHYKLSQALYDECDRRGVDREDRVVLQDVGDDMRSKEGLAVLAKHTINKIVNDDPENKNKYVIESIRNHNELTELKKQFGNELITLNITAPIEDRYQRAIERKVQYKEHDLTFEEFKRNDTRDLGVGNAENEQNVAKCMELADKEIQNIAGIIELEKKIEQAIKLS